MDDKKDVELELAARLEMRERAIELLRAGANPLAGHGEALAALARFAGEDVFELVRPWIGGGRDERVESALSVACAVGNAAWVRALAPLSGSARARERGAFIAGKSRQWECFEICGGMRWLDDAKRMLVVGSAAQARDWDGVAKALDGVLVLLAEREDMLSRAPASFAAGRMREIHELREKLWVRAAKVAARLDDQAGALMLGARAPSLEAANQGAKAAIAHDAPSCLAAWAREEARLTWLAQALSAGAKYCALRLLPRCDPQASVGSRPLAQWAATPELAALVEAEAISRSASSPPKREGPGRL